MQRDARHGRIGLLLAAVLALVLALGGCSGSDAKAPTPVKGPLSILLVNDDGWDAPGITAAYDALVAAGHDVTLVAPLTNQSGISSATSTSALTVTQPEKGSPKFAVAGTPVDSLSLGLFGVLSGKRPDLVVSGINLGANVAGNTTYSGTVGAASAAAEAGIPAIAVSADTDAAGEADFADAATTVVDVVAALAADGFDGLGAAGFLNVNVPAATASRSAPRGIKAVSPGTGGPRTVTYAKTGPTTWTPTFSYDARVGSPAADAERLADGWTTVSWLTTARTSTASGRAVAQQLAGQLGR